MKLPFGKWTVPMYLAILVFALTAWSYFGDPLTAIIVSMLGWLCIRAIYVYKVDGAGTSLDEVEGSNSTILIGQFILWVVFIVVGVLFAYGLVTGSVLFVGVAAGGWILFLVGSRLPWFKRFYGTPLGEG